MSTQRIIERETNSCLIVLNYAIQENLPETAKEVARWMAGIVLELAPEFSDLRHMTYAQKPYIVKNYQDATGA